MHFSTLFLAVEAAALFSGACAFPYSSTLRRQAPTSNVTSPQARADAVKEAFTFAWDGYYKYAFPHDELHPVSDTYGDSRNGWGASAADAFSTALVMEIPEIVNEILDFIPTIDFNQTTTQVSLFETTIRYMAGMLSAYDLLTGPLANMTTNSSNVDALLTQSKSLADVLKYAFDTPTGIPSNNLNINNKTNDGSATNGLATIGSLVLEWTHLSDLTGDPEYATLSQKGESYLLNPQPASDEPFPGLVGTDVNITSGLFVDASGGWSGGDDSFYEYLLKMYVYDSTRFGAYKDRWTLAADSTIRNLSSHPSSRPDLTFLAMYDGPELDFESEHLTCFDGGNFILGGAVLDRPDYVSFGLELVNGCHDTYAATATGIGPEIFSWNTTTLPANQSAFYDAAGFWIEDAIYDLRPEVLESYYYAYRVTGNTTYQDWAWDAFVAINATARQGSGFTAISDVNVPGGGEPLDNQESFLFAEVMKYAYLIHTEDAAWQVQAGAAQSFVFNTEAHPLKVAHVAG
ncbi:MAG: maturation of Asn-linked oligosaccharides protein [Sarea resinae]|nr:MAG: maturation of Asn-linked oligosaccharides protein [Sarea resinae]